MLWLVLPFFDPFGGSIITVPYADSIDAVKESKEMYNLSVVETYELYELTSNASFVTGCQTRI